MDANVGHVSQRDNGRDLDGEYERLRRVSVDTDGRAGAGREASLGDQATGDADREAIYHAVAEAFSMMGTQDRERGATRSETRYRKRV
ncbi:MAG: hypothetical protein RIC38_08125, partial [Chromatocurvus sp.]